MPETIETTQVPTTFIEMAASKRDDVARAPGLVFTLEDLKKVNAYVQEGLTLPTEASAGRRYIGNQAAGTAGLEPAAIGALFAKIRANAASWNELNLNISSVSANLEDVARRLITTGDDLVTAIDALDLVQKVKTHVGDTSIRLEDLPKDQVPHIAFTDYDKKQAQQLGKLLDNMKFDVSMEKESTSQLLTQINNFRTEIVQQLEPQVKNKLEIAGRVSKPLDSSTKMLLTEIEEKNKEIDAEREEYQKYKKLAFTGAAGGLIGLAITGGIYGHKAEKARKHKNELIDERTKLENQLGPDQALLKALLAVERHFMDLDTRLIDAEMAVSHLHTVWTTFETNLDSSIQQFGQITNSTSLSQFLRSFKLAMDAWQTVETETIELNQLFHIYQVTANFARSKIRTAHCSVNTGIESKYNAYYGHSWILHARGTSFFEITFKPNDAPGNRAHLKMRHLTSMNRAKPGFSPIDISINGQMFKASYSPNPLSSNWVNDTFDISSFVRRGDNVIRLQLENAAVTNYWIRWLGILLS